MRTMTDLAQGPVQKDAAPRLRADVAPAGGLIHEPEPADGDPVARDLLALLLSAENRHADGRRPAWRGGAEIAGAICPGVFERPGEETGTDRLWVGRHRADPRLAPGSRNRSGSGIRTWSTRICRSVGGVSGVRWRTWGRLTPAVGSMVDTLAVRSKNMPIETSSVVSSIHLVDHLELRFGRETGGRDPHAAGAPAVGHRSFTVGKRHLLAGAGDAVQDRPADFPLRSLVGIGEDAIGFLYRLRYESAERAAARCWSFERQKQ